MKHLILIILFTLVAAQFVLCHAEVFEVSATIPLIPGVNYFPETVDIAPALGKDHASKNTMQQLVFKDGQQMILETHVIK